MLETCRTSVAAKLRSWITASPRIDKDPKGIKEMLFFLIGVFLAIIFGVVTMPVIVMWLGWLFCWCMLLYVIQSSVYKISEYPRKTRLLLAIVLAVGFIGVFWSTARGQWREEKAAVLEGDLVGAGLAINDGKQHGFPMLQIGEGTTLVMTPDGVADIFPFFRDSGVRIEWGYKGPLLTTPVRDRNGNLLAEITRNHWRVYPQYCADKNYTKEVLEIKDSAGHVVLQVRILPDRIRLQGEWWNTEGNGIRLLGVPNPTPAQGSMVVPLNRQNQHIESLIQPIFEYPGKDHWREFRQDRLTQ